ncbi:MAG: hypothetical protein JWQ93_2015 [Marmoricola sp.]|nr:hypothetical protein [Marmoricola sp.]
MTTTIPTRPDVNAPHATRSRGPGWRNPRLLLGVLLVAASVVLGARLLAAADDSVGVWSVARDLPAGAAVDQGDLVRRQVRFPDSETANGYLAAGDDPPEAAILNRPVSAGELLPRAALAERTGPDLLEVPISVAADDLPATVRQGSVVDVWVTPKVPASGGSGPRAVRVLTDVVVVAVPRTSDGFAPQASRQVIVGVPVARSDDLATALGGMADGRVVIARKG